MRSSFILDLSKVIGDSRIIRAFPAPYRELPSKRGNAVLLCGSHSYKQTGRWQMDCFKSSGSSGDFQLSQEAGGWWPQGLLCSLQVFLAWGWPPPREEADRQTPTFVGTDALKVVDVKSTIQALQGILQSRALNISYLCLRR